MKKVDRDSFGDAISNGVVAIDFFSKSCKVCVMTENILERACKKYNGNLIAYKCDVEENPEIASRYKIMGLPTIILFKNGIPSKQVVGSCSERKLENILNDMIGG